MNGSTGLHARLADRSARAGVVGLGYVGLPLAVEFARAGFVTTGIDVDPHKVDAVNQGTSYIPDVPTADPSQRQPNTLYAGTTRLYRSTNGFAIFSRSTGKSRRWLSDE